MAVPVLKIKGGVLGGAAGSRTINILTLGEMVIISIGIEIWDIRVP